MDRGKKLEPNNLNDLYSKEWIRFQKSWFIHNPPPRNSDVLVHPAKFPEDLVEEFIRFFTSAGQTVLDPMAGTGSALIAALRSGRAAYGIELQEKYASIARERMETLCEELNDPPDWDVATADASEFDYAGIPTIDYCITSPPYWDMLRRKGYETQQKRRANDDLDTHYSEDYADVGNIEEYEAFLEALVTIYRRVSECLRDRAYMTIIVKNVKKGGTIYPLAWDLARHVSEFLTLKDEKIWCQDNQRLAPYGMGHAWVSNTMHHYCLNFRNE
ncbi:MAG: DNA methyltransferase [Armatimonadota bacterium]